MPCVPGALRVNSGSELGVPGAHALRSNSDSNEGALRANIHLEV